jgi:hypothetical protein
MTHTWRLENGDVALDIQGRVEQIGGSRKVVQDLKNWMLNDKGFNSFQPKMGTYLDSYVGQESDPRMLHDIRNEVRQVLEDYMETQMSDLKKRIEERGDPYIAIGLAEPSSLVDLWTDLAVRDIPGAIEITVVFKTFTDDIDEVVVVLERGNHNSTNDLG